MNQSISIHIRQWLSNMKRVNASDLSTFSVMNSTESSLLTEGDDPSFSEAFFREAVELAFSLASKRPYRLAQFCHWVWVFYIR